jgi:hypothetical protein
MRKLTPRVGAGVTVLLLVGVAMCAPTEAAGERSALAGTLSGSVLAVWCLAMSRPWRAPTHGLRLLGARLGRTLDTTACRPAIPSVITAGALRQGRVLPTERWLPATASTLST